MKKSIPYILLATLAGAAALTQNLLREPSSTATPPPVAATEPPTAAYEGCAYTWATRDAPEAGDRLKKAIREIHPEAEASASLFGEECTYADGRVTFGAMETDFYIGIPVQDPKDEETLGNLMAQAMPIIEEVIKNGTPASPGFVEFSFQANGSSPLFIRVPINEYADKAQGKNGAELFRLFHTTP